MVFIRNVDLTSHSTYYRGANVTVTRDHRDLRVWQTAIELGIHCYELSRGFPREERYGLTAQLRNAAVSVAANIAEGNGRLTTGEYLNQLSAARGSLREVDTHLEFAYRLEYAPSQAISEVRSLLDVDAAQLTRLIYALKRKTGTRR
jgi:four helix bundle protein